MVSHQPAKFGDYRYFVSGYILLYCYWIYSRWRAIFHMLAWTCHYCLFLKHIACHVFIHKISDHRHNYLSVWPRRTSDSGNKCFQKQLAERTQKTFASPSKNAVEKKKRERRKQQKIGDDLSVCVLNFLVEVGALPSLVLWKWRCEFLKMSRELTLATLPHVVHVTKWSHGFMGENFSQ